MGEQRDKHGWGEYINDLSPRDDWWRASRWFPEYFGQLFRLRGIVTLAASKIGTIAAMVYAHAELPVIIAFSVPAVIVVALVMYARSLLIAASEADSALHQVMHQMRDRLNEVVTSETDQAKLRAVKDFYADACRQIACYFRHRSGDLQLSCCLRVMEVSGDGKQQFVTRGRADGLAPSRDRTSEPIGVDEGIVAAFLKKGGEGAFRIDDLAAAQRAGIWKGTPNDTTYQDIKFVFVCPINGFYEGGKRMLGLLYLTSRSQPIQQIYWNPLEAIADTLGAVLPRLYEPADSGSPPS